MRRLALGCFVRVIAQASQRPVCRTVDGEANGINDTAEDETRIAMPCGEDGGVEAGDGGGVEPGKESVGKEASDGDE